MAHNKHLLDSFTLWFSLSAIEAHLVSLASLICKIILSLPVSLVVLVDCLLEWSRSMSNRVTYRVNIYISEFTLNPMGLKSYEFFQWKRRWCFKSILIERTAFVSQHFLVCLILTKVMVQVTAYLKNYQRRGDQHSALKPPLSSKLKFYLQNTFCQPWASTQLTKSAHCACVALTFLFLYFSLILSYSNHPLQSPSWIHLPFTFVPLFPHAFPLPNEKMGNWACKYPLNY